MDKAKLEYIAEMGLGTKGLERVREIIDIYENVLDFKVNDIFVSEYLDQQGGRIYEGLWLFNENFIGEAKNFIAENDFDLISIKHSVLYFNVQFEDYNFKKATAKSRILADMVMTGNSSVTLKASGKNCDFLSDVAMKYFRTNI